MKKTQFAPEFSVAMSLETGCIVMVRMQGDRQKVMGSLEREASIQFARSIINWIPEAIAAPVETPKPQLTLVNGSG